MIRHQNVDAAAGRLLDLGPLLVPQSAVTISVRPSAVARSIARSDRPWPSPSRSGAYAAASRPSRRSASTRMARPGQAVGVEVAVHQHSLAPRPAAATRKRAARASGSSRGSCSPSCGAARKRSQLLRRGRRHAPASSTSSRGRYAALQGNRPSRQDRRRRPEERASGIEVRSCRRASHRRLTPDVSVAYRAVREPDAGSAVARRPPRARAMRRAPDVDPPRAARPRAAGWR